MWLSTRCHVHGANRHRRDQSTQTLPTLTVIAACRRVYANTCGRVGHEHRCLERMATAILNVFCDQGREQTLRDESCLRTSP
jgi:hypothetical protein